MERRRWRKSYSSIYELPCPRCQKGLLKWDRKSVRQHETAASRLSNRDNYGPPETTSVFSGLMTCNIVFCAEVVMVSGYVDLVDEIPPSEEVPDPGLSTYYRPKVFLPAPFIIYVSAKLSPECQADLKSSFALLWSDYPACANRLRSFVEHLLDQLGVPRLSPKNGRLPLKQRIDAFNKAHPGHENIMQALLLVGNNGSHGVAPSFDDLLDSYQLVEAAIADLIEKQRDKTEEIARRLIAKMQT